MRLKSVILAVEDRLSDAVATKILEHFGIEIARKTGYKGNSYLQQKAQNQQSSARRTRYFYVDRFRLCPKYHALDRLIQEKNTLTGEQKISTLY